MTSSSAFYLLDKPKDFTSFDIVQILRWKLKTKKIWHTWTLDPLATGALLIATWRYTKLIPYFENDTKDYEFTINFDWQTDSYDLWTPINFISKEKQEKTSKDITSEKINSILEKHFSWKIMQIPPKYSAIKIWWRKALHMVKEWEDFELNERECFIHEIKLLDYSYPRASLYAKVSSWTYIRSIANDLWNILWTWGYITDLRRVKIWDLDISDAILLNEFKRDKKLLIKDLFVWKDFISLEADIHKKINNWIRVGWNFDFKINKELFVLTNDEITNIVLYDWEYLIPIRKFWDL